MQGKRGKGTLFGWDTEGREEIVDALSWPVEWLTAVDRLSCTRDCKHPTISDFCNHKFLLLAKLAIEPLILVPKMRVLMDRRKKKRGSVWRQSTHKTAAQFVVAIITVLTCHCRGTYFSFCSVNSGGGGVLNFFFWWECAVRVSKSRV